MKIEFKITEDFNSIIAQLESGEENEFRVVEIFDHNELLPEYQEGCNYKTARIWEIRDLNFDCAATVRLINGNGSSTPDNINIHTAFSGYEYIIYNPVLYSSAQADLFGKQTYCTYEGAFRGLLAQNLLPFITPEFTGEEEVKSSFKWCSLKEYCELQSKFAKFREENDASAPYHAFPKAIFEWLKNMG